MIVQEDEVFLYTPERVIGSIWVRMRQEFIEVCQFGLSVRREKEILYYRSGVVGCVYVLVVCESVGLARELLLQQ